MEPNFESDNYYEILGLSKTATEQEIRKRYKTYAKKYHPDRQEDKDKERCSNIFKKISEAYEILSDPEKRQNYDKFGKEGVKNNIQGVNPFDIFNNIFGGFSGFNFGDIGSQMFGNNKHTNVRVAPLEHRLHLDVKTIYNGKKVKLSIKRKRIFSNTNKIVEPHEMSNTYTNCDKCRGTGRLSQTIQIGPGMVTTRNMGCDKCMGNGLVLKSEYVSKEVEEIIIVDIKPGTMEGTKYIYENKGDMLPGRPVSDLIVIVLGKTDSNAERAGNDIHVKMDMNLGDALIGTIVSFKHFDERVLNIKKDFIICPNMVKKVKGEGMPILGKNEKGDLYIHFNVVFPEKLTSEEKKSIGKVFKVSKNHLSSHKTFSS